MNIARWVPTLHSIAEQDIEHTLSRQNDSVGGPACESKVIRQRLLFFLLNIVTLS